MTSLKTLIGLDFAAQTGELSVNDVCISPAIGPNIWPARNGVDCDRSFFANTPLAITPGPFQLSSLRSQLRGEGKEEDSFFVVVLSFLARSLVPLFLRFPPLNNGTFHGKVSVPLRPPREYFRSHLRSRVSFGKIELCIDGSFVERNHLRTEREHA